MKKSSLNGFSEYHRKALDKELDIVTSLDAWAFREPTIFYCRYRKSAEKLATRLCAWHADFGIALLHLGMKNSALEYNTRKALGGVKRCRHIVATHNIFCRGYSRQRLSKGRYEIYISI